MPQDKEREIQLQFLEEAQEYLDTIESTLVGLASNPIDAQQMDAVLRAAHSVKGGAGMMGYQTLSHLAHRLEDSFKVLKAQRNSLAIDGELERLLLTAVDRLRQVLSLNRQGADVHETWLEKEGNPIFDQLHNRLGDPQADDAATMLSAEDGTNVAALLFETEVAGCLARLESVLADPQAPCLEEEVSIMAQELGGLGEMLQLEAFTSLCESVVQTLETAPGHVREIAQLALDAWRRSQALVLVGQISSLPTQLPWHTPLEKDREMQRHADAETLSDIDLSHPIPSEVVEETWLFDDLVAEFDLYRQEAELIEPDLTPTTLEPHTPIIEPIELDLTAAQFEAHTPIIEPIELEITPHTPTPPPPTPPLQRTDVRWREVKTAATTEPTPTQDTQDNTVRIPVRQLDRLNDLFGELTIERNGLSLNLARLRTLINTLSRRVSHLEQSNIRLRTAYDSVATQSSALPKGLQNQPPRSPSPAAFSPLLSTLVGEDLSSSFDALEMDRYSDLHLLSMDVMETIVQIQEVTSDVELSLEDTDGTTRELNQTAKQLQTHITRIRMRPLSDLVGRFTRAIRDLCLQHGKQVELKVSGKGTLIDRSILEALSDPLMHLVRNAFDHGIEKPDVRLAQGKPAQGTIEIKAAHRGNQTIITISDDGNGINLNKIRARAEAMGLDAELLAAASEDELLSLIFEPGFSTADQVTDLSGRGVGMDVVRNNLKLIRGDIRVDTTPLKGTTFTLTVPFTLSVARVLLVESHGMMLAFPTDVIEEMLLLEPEQVLTTPGSEVLKWEGEMIPLIRLGAWLTFRCSRKVMTLEGVPTISEPTVLMIAQGEQLVALQVERCWGEQEIAIRKVEGPLEMPPGFASCTILGDGKVVPLVDVGSLLRWIASERNLNTDSSLVGQLPPLSTQSADNSPTVDYPQTAKATILVVDDSINVRRFLALALEKAGYLVEQAKDGQDAVEKLLGGLHVQAVICDIEMPRLDGYGFLARIKSNPAFSDLPIAMLTSRTGDKHRQLAITLGASAYFSKPYNERELLGTLSDLINARISA